MIRAISWWKYLIIGWFILAGCNAGENKKPPQQLQNVGTKEVQIKLSELDSLKKEIIKQPNNADNYAERSKLYLEIENNQMAIGDLERAISLDSSNVSYHFSLAVIHYTIGNSDRALEGFNHCLLLDPNHVGALLKLAKIYFVFKHYPTAFDYINRALKVNEFLPEGYYLKGMIYKEIGDTVKSVSSFHTAREVKGDFYNASMQIALLYAKTGNKLALEFYNDALRIAPQSIEAWYNKGMFFQEEDNLDSAHACYEKIIELDSTYSAAFYNRGFIHLVFEDKFNEAIVDFTEVLELDSTHCHAYYNRGYAYELLGNNKLAEKDYRKSLTINSSFELAAKGLSRLGF